MPNARELSPALTFDDILLVPQHSNVQSRSSVDLSAQITARRRIRIPVWSANMDSVTGGLMAGRMATLGGIGVIHRYLSVADQVSEVELAAAIAAVEEPLAAAVGAKDDRHATLEDRARALVDAGVSVLVIDIAHGDHEMTLRALERLHAAQLGTGRDGMSVDIVAGNVATPEAVERLVAAGADAVKAGIGPGSLCTTRIMTGHGVPQFTAILEAASVTDYIIGDGGIRYPGDVVKSLAAGASSVMIGSLLAGTDEAPGDIIVIDGERMKKYRGMASFDAQTAFFDRPVDTPEGVATLVAHKGPAADVIRELIGGIRSGCSYSGVHAASELRTAAKWRRVTAAGLRESHAHGKN